MDAIDQLPALRDVIARFDLGARKTLGQHFLLDLNLTARIARGAGELEGVTVVEVGPGPGGLTRALLQTQARHVVAIERDSRFISALADLSAAAAGRLTLLEADALDVNFEAIAPAPRAVVANLPYNVATPLLVGWLRNIHAWASLTIMVQKEVAERICAPPHTKARGRLSVMSQWRTVPRILFQVPARAFTPPPKVDSAIVHLVPRNMPQNEAVSWDIMERLVAAAFGQRRKMLRASLRSLIPDTESFLQPAGIDPQARAETLEVEDFVRLAKAYHAEPTCFQGPGGDV
ncbi:MAG: 16S rRNA (adenine(1518)-N(6)/adenine(1519)-N(6))-dimethyltransferase RsmA [Pseudomonadota bacterium]|nr:16S rRNA (adenine(1518)-N(6)/adenine(1519)-N(6))-dimethyltransferase RsmA [Pseudomonadota bacterium]